MAWFHWLRSKQELIREVACLKREIESLERQVTAATDFIDRMSWEARAAGAKAKAVTESLREKTKEQA